MDLIRLTSLISEDAAGVKGLLVAEVSVITLDVVVDGDANCDNGVDNASGECEDNAPGNDGRF